MTRRIVLVVLAVALLAVAYELASSGRASSLAAAEEAERQREARAAELTAAVPPTEPAPLVPLPVREAQERPTERRRTARRPMDGTKAAKTSPAGVRLAGTLRRASDASPAPGVELELQGRIAADLVRVITGADGTFRSQDALPPGLVRARLGGSARGRALAGAPRVEPAAVVVPESAAILGEHALDLVLHEPDALVRVQLVRKGSPAAGDVFARTPLGSGKWTTDGSGAVDLAFPGLQAGDRVTLRASADLAHAEAHELVFPWEPGVVELELVPRAFVQVRVVDAEGRPLSGRCVVAGANRSFTQKDGCTMFLLGFGTHRVFLRDEPAVETVIEVSRIEAIQAELVSAARLLVAGRVLAEGGEPLPGVSVSALALDVAMGAVTDDDGRFEIRAAPRESAAVLRVWAGGGVDAERFEPAELRVGEGKTDVVFRRVAALPELELTLAVLEAGDARVLPRAVVVVHRASAPLQRDAWTSSDGVLSLELRPHADLVVLARALGYRERVLAWEDVEAAACTGELLPIALGPGLELSLLAWSRAEDRPLPGATLLGDGVPLATSDAAGRLRLAGARWPTTIRVEAPGHAPRELTARELLTEAAIELDRP